MSTIYGKLGQDRGVNVRRAFGLEEKAYGSSWVLGVAGSWLEGFRPLLSLNDSSMHLQPQQSIQSVVS